MTSANPLKACPSCGTPAPVSAAACAKCGHGYRSAFQSPPVNQTTAFQAPQQPTVASVGASVAVCPRCSAPIGAGFVACPYCGTSLYAKPVTSTGIIALMHGLGAMAVLFFLGNTFSHGSEQAVKLLTLCSMISAVAALVCAVVLACRKSVYDRINGWAIIGLQVVTLIILSVGAIAKPDEPKAQASTPDSRPTYYDNGNYYQR